MWRMGSGPCETSSLRILSEVTAAAAAIAMGECVLSGLRLGGASRLKLAWRIFWRAGMFGRGVTDERERGFTLIVIGRGTEPRASLPELGGGALVRLASGAGGALGAVRSANGGDEESRGASDASDTRSAGTADMARCLSTEISAPDATKSCFLFRLARRDEIRVGLGLAADQG